MDSELIDIATMEGKITRQQNYILKQRFSRLTFQQIADNYECTRQYIHKKYTEAMEVISNASN